MKKKMILYVKYEKKLWKVGEGKKMERKDSDDYKRENI